eukprot:TRINITY_DN2318_c0_g1_i6.p1 TRINITY_DN2318_c0_g1~~TRINITY_DN2318_c0_g1_i6.p1  ORF type:complete len:1235 (+),score=365.77 TRINITY_DN2318_c0_g1_i6:165-3869(+)
MVHVGAAEGAAPGGDGAAGPADVDIPYPAPLLPELAPVAAYIARLLHSTRGVLAKVWREGEPEDVSEAAAEADAHSRVGNADADDGGITRRLGDGLRRDKSNFRAGDLAELKRAMREGTLNTDTPPPDCPCVFEWARMLPSRWKEQFSVAERAAQAWEGGVGDYFAEDFVQPAAERLPDGACRPRTPGGATCLLDNWSRVARRVLRSLQGHETIRPHHHVPVKVQLVLAAVGAEEAGEGIAVIYVYSYEIKSPEGKSRLTQLYSTATRCMREMGDPAWRKRLAQPTVGRHRRTIELFAPFLWRLDRILLQLPHEAIMVFRGIDCRVADDYEMTTLVPWASHTSTSTDRDVSWGFMKETAGTFFIVLAESVACVSFFSWLPDEDEWLMHTQCVLQVASKLDPSLQQMLGTNHDIVVMFQCDRRGGGAEDPRQKVENALMAARESALIFGPFLETFVEPTVASAPAGGGAGSTGPLLKAFNAFMHDPHSQVAVLVGDGGTGKTSAGLRLVNEALSVTVSSAPEGTDGQVLPVFVSLPAVAKLLCRKPSAGWTPLVDHIRLSLSLSSEAELAELQRRPLLLLLDSVEEAVGAHSLLKLHTLLEIGGIRLCDWPLAQVVFTVRGELLEHEGITPSNLGGPCETWRLQPFTPELADKYADNVASITVRQLAREIGPLWIDDAKVAQKLHRLPCPPPEFAAAKTLQEETRRLVRSGLPLRKASEEAANGEPGQRCFQEVMAAIRGHYAAIRAADETLLSTAFVATMVVAAGRDLDPEALNVDARREVYAAWCKNTVRRRLPRVAGKLKDVPCPSRAPVLRRRESWARRLSRRLSGASEAREELAPFGELDEEAQIDLVLHFCMDLAVSEIMLQVDDSAFRLYACLHRMVRVGDVVRHYHGQLERRYNRILLEAAPLRLQSTKNDDALLSFRHSTVHDHLAVERFRLHFEDQAASRSGVEVPPYVSKRMEAARSFTQRVSMLSRKRHPGFDKWLAEAAAASGPEAVQAVKVIQGSGIISLILMRLCMFLLAAAVGMIIVWSFLYGDWPNGLTWIVFVSPHFGDFIGTVCLGLDTPVQRRVNAATWAAGCVLFAAASAMRIVRDCEWEKDHDDVRAGFDGSCIQHHLLFTLGIGLPFMLLYPTHSIQYFAAGLLNMAIWRYESQADVCISFLLVGLTEAAFLAFIVLDSTIWSAPWWITYSGGGESNVSSVAVDVLFALLWAKALYGMIVHCPRPLAPVEEG